MFKKQNHNKLDTNIYILKLTSDLLFILVNVIIRAVKNKFFGISEINVSYGLNYF